MKAVFRENLGEAIIGLLVVLFAGFFIVYVWQATGGEHGGGIKVTALFPNASGVNVGTDVRVAGLKIGQVTEQKLDPKSYQVAVTMALDPQVKLPADSSAAITSEGLLGATFIALTPGGSDKMFQNGDTIVDTQGSMDLMSLVGQFINKPSSGGSAAPAAGAGKLP